MGMMNTPRLPSRSCGERYKLHRWRPAPPDCRKGHDHNGQPKRRCQAEDGKGAPRSRRLYPGESPSRCRLAAVSGARLRLPGRQARWLPAICLISSPRPTSRPTVNCQGCPGARPWSRSAARGRQSKVRGMAWLSLPSVSRCDVHRLPKMNLRDRPERLQRYLYCAIDDCTRLHPVGSSELTPRPARIPTRCSKNLPFPPPGGYEDRTGTEYTLIFMAHCRSPTPSKRLSLPTGYAISSSP